MIENVMNDNIKVAIEIAESMIDLYPENLTDSLYWAACLYSIDKKIDKVVHCFDLALSKNIWWSTDSISKESDFKNVRSNPQFINVLRRMENVSRDKIACSSSHHIKVKNNSTSQYIINLHWKNDSVESYRKYFDNIYCDRKINAIYIQSSIAESSKGFSWNSYERAYKDIENELTYLKGEITVVSGTSQGGRIALSYAIEKGYDYLGIMPALNAPEIEINVGISYCFIIGDKDDYYGNVSELHKRILEMGGKSKLIVMQGISHYFPDNFMEYYNQVL